MYRVPVSWMPCDSMIFGTILGLYRQPGFDMVFSVAGLEPAALIRSDLLPERSQDVDGAGRLVASGEIDTNFCNAERHVPKFR